MITIQSLAWCSAIHCIEMLYREGLRREPSPFELEQWLNSMRRDGMDRLEVAARVTFSREGRRSCRRIHWRLMTLMLWTLSALVIRKMPVIGKMIFKAMTVIPNAVVMMKTMHWITCAATVHQIDNPLVVQQATTGFPADEIEELAMYLGRLRARCDDMAVLLAAANGATTKSVSLVKSPA